MKVVSAVEVPLHFFKHWVLNYGVSTDLLAENGGAVTSNVFHNVCKLMQIYKSLAH